MINNKRDMEKSHIYILKKQIPVTKMEIDVDRIFLWKENPRIERIVKMRKIDGQSQLKDLLATRKHVKELKKRIINHGGLVNPIVVRKRKTKGKYEVLEGNCRLTCYKDLNEEQPKTYGSILANIIEKDLTTKELDSWLWEIHGHGQHQWDPLERANYIYKKHKQGTSDENIVDDLKIKLKDVKNDIATIQLYNESKDDNEKHYSHYNELAKSQNLKKYTKKDNAKRRRIFDSIINDEISALDIRNKLIPIVKKPDIFEEWYLKKIDLDTAFEQFIDEGGKSPTASVFSNFAARINKPKFQRSCYKLVGKKRKTFLIAAKQINLIINDLLDKMEPKDDDELDV